MECDRPGAAGPAGTFPAFGLKAALLKVAALNQLYGTNVYAVVRMAQHVVSTMENTMRNRIALRLLRS